MYTNPTSYDNLTILQAFDEAIKEAAVLGIALKDYMLRYYDLDEKEFWITFGAYKTLAN